MRSFHTIGPALVVLAVTAVTLFAAPAAIRQVQLANLTARVTLAQNALDRSDMLERLNAETTSVADASLPSVVHLNVRSRDANSRRRGQANGSGWIFDDRGHIVTNAHVVVNAERVSVEFYDGRIAQANVVGLDPLTDIAVLKVDPGAGVLPIRRATGQPLKTGERVFAFGSPFGIRFSMSEGIVSGLGRSEGANMLGLRTGYTNYIQTDAAINPGNSGGPLVNVNGRLVGMNTAIANAADQSGENSFTGQSAGIGFAVPLETIERVAAQLINYDIVLRGYLGISFADRFRNQANLTLEERGFTGDGVTIGNVPEGQPAAVAGLRFGDIIVAIDGRKTTSPDILRSIVSVQEPGTEVSITIVRAEQGKVDVPVRLGAAYDTLRGGLRYVPGSQDMTTAEIMASLRQGRDESGASE